MEAISWEARRGRLCDGWLTLFKLVRYISVPTQTATPASNYVASPVGVELKEDKPMHPT